MMNQLIEKFPAQLVEALEIGEAASIKPHTEEINKVYVAGLGGSGIGADFVNSFIREECTIPYMTGKGYSIPKYVDKNTLAIASSYSGNTEETLYSFKEMVKTGAKIVVISSGGKLIEMAKENGFDYIVLPGDWPSPRACLGYSLVQQLFVLRKLGFISNESILSIKSSIDLIKYNQEEIKEEAKNVANFLFGKRPIIYSTDRIEPVAVRFRQQINENAKLLCWHHVIPEMNHNELVGWKDVDAEYAVVYLRNADDFSRNSTRIEINKKIIGKLTPNIIEINSKGKNLIERSIYLVHLVDWVTWYLSDLRKQDSIEVDVIDYLKSELAKV